MADEAASTAPLGRNSVRVSGTRRDLFVEFHFIAGDPDLSVELILPMPAFLEFCSINDALMQEPETPEAGEAYAALCRRYGQTPGRPDRVLAR